MKTYLIMVAASLFLLVCSLFLPSQIFAQVMGGPMRPIGPIAQTPSLRDHKTASSGNNIYFIWSVQNPGQGMSLFFEKSADGGKTFGNPMLLANTTRIDKPDISTSDNNVYVVWDQQENQSKIMVLRSTDSGTTFQDPVAVITGNATQFTIGAVTSYGNNVNLVWTGLFGPNRTQSVMISQSTDGGATFGDPVLLSDSLLQSNEQSVAQSNSVTYVVWNSRQNCPDPMGNCKTMLFLRPINDGTVGDTVHLESLDGVFPIAIVANSNTVLVEGLKRTYDDAVFENSTITMMQSHDWGKTFSTTSSTYNVYMDGIFPVLTDSMLYQFWTVYELGLQPEPIYVERSSDVGKTFGMPEEISGATTPLAVQLDSQITSYGNSAYAVWSGTDKAGAQHVFLGEITPDSLGRIRTIEDLYQAGGFHISQGGLGLYLSFGAGQNLFFESVNDTSYTERGLPCPINQDPQTGSVILDRPEAMVDGMPSSSILTGWDVATSTEMHAVHNKSYKTIYQIQAIKDGNVTFQSQENYTVTCGYSPNNVIYWSPQAAGNYTIVASLLNPNNKTDTIYSNNQTVQVSENKYLGNFSATTPVQFKIVNDSSALNQGGWAKFTVKAGPSSPNYRLHNISLWIDAPRGIEAWFDKYSIFSYDYKLDNLTMYVYAGSAAAPGTNSLKIEGRGVAANLLNGTIFDVGNPMPPAGGNLRLPTVITSEHENGRQVGALNVTINSTGRPSSYAVIGPPNLHPFTFCSKEPMINGYGGGTNCMGFVGYEDFPVTVYSDVTRTVSLGATNLPNGTWVKFLPQQVVATPEGTPSKLVMAGAGEPFEINVLSVKVGHIYANTTQGSSVTYMPLGGGEKVDILDGKGPVEFDAAGVNINHTTPSSLGMVYDSTSGSLPVSFTVLGVSQNNTTVPLPSWLSVKLVPSSFTLNYSQPFYMKVETGTMAPPTGAHATVLVGEKIGGKNYTGHIQVSIPPAVYFGGGGIRLGPTGGGGTVHSHKAPALQPPLKQIKPGMSIGDIRCNAGLQLVLKAEDGSPACVTHETAQKLVERGWAHPPLANHGPAESSFGPRIPVYRNIINSSTNPLSKERTIYTIWGNDAKVHNETDASLLAGYAVRFPTKLPANYTLQLAVMRPLLPQHKYVYLFYSESPIQDTMRVHDFWHDKGIMIRYDYNSNWMHDPNYGNWTGYIRGEKVDGYPDAHDMIINGYKGWAGSNHTGNFEGWPIQNPSVIEYNANGVEVQLFGGISLDKLAAVGLSIPY
ncbi:MAG: hypothetical protein KGI27_10180 [Thaumarchaeota archaeon]|nr:hypothetical protein [Nitrososphaerota archaeon]